MPISTRNQLRRTIQQLVLGNVMAHVVVRVGENVIESVITRRSAEELKLKQGDTVTHQGNRSDDSEGLKPKGCHLILAKRNLFRRDPISGVTSKRRQRLASNAEYRDMPSAARRVTRKQTQVVGKTHSWVRPLCAKDTTPRFGFMSRKLTGSLPKNLDGGAARFCGRDKVDFFTALSSLRPRLVTGEAV